MLVSKPTCVALEVTPNQKAYICRHHIDPSMRGVLTQPVDVEKDTKQLHHCTSAISNRT